MADPKEQARHLALAADDADDDVAGVLDAAARLAASRGAPDAAAELCGQSCRVTPAERVDELRRRVVATAGHCFASGDLARARDAAGRDHRRLASRNRACRRLAPPGERFASGATAAGMRSATRTRSGSKPGRQPARRPHRPRLGPHPGSGWPTCRRPRHHAYTAVGNAERMDDPGLLAQALAVAVMVDFLSGHGVDEAKI